MVLGPVSPPSRKFLCRCVLEEVLDGIGLIQRLGYERAATAQQLSPNPRRRGAPHPVFAARAVSRLPATYAPAAVLHQIFSQSWWKGRGGGGRISVVRFAWAFDRGELSVEPRSAVP